MNHENNKDDKSKDSCSVNINMSTKVGKNTNILSHIFLFNNVKDYSILASVNSTFNKLTHKNDLYYKDDCNNYFYFNTSNKK